MTLGLEVIAVIGGTGAQGRGLVLRLAQAGEDVIIGSRWREKAERVAAELSAQIGKPISGAENLQAARAGDPVILSVPYDAMKKIVEEIKPALPGKILINVAVPLEIEGGRVTLKPPAAGSASEELIGLVPPDVRIVSAFQTVGAKRLQDLSKPLDCDVIVCSDDADAKAKVMKLAERLPGVRAVDGGPLRNTRLVEPVVALLVQLTLRKKAAGIGVRFAGL
jgi:hypothetical protein